MQDDNRNAEPWSGARVPVQIQAGSPVDAESTGRGTVPEQHTVPSQGLLGKMIQQRCWSQPFLPRCIESYAKARLWTSVFLNFHHYVGINIFEYPTKDVHIDCQASFVDQYQPFQCICKATRWDSWSWCRVDLGTCAFSISRQHLKDSHLCLLEEAPVLFLGGLITLSYSVISYLWLCKIDPN